MSKTQMGFRKILMPAAVWTNIKLSVGTETLPLLPKLTHSVVSTETDSSEYNSHHLHQDPALSYTLEGSIFLLTVRETSWTLWICLQCFFFLNASCWLQVRYERHCSSLPVIVTCQFYYWKDLSPLWRHLAKKCEEASAGVTFFLWKQCLK